jgi:hypothetical protein
MTGQSKDEDLKISLVTFSPGDQLTEWWGHTALIVEDSGNNQARLYNYGMFGFSDGFVHRFVQGRLEFWVDDGVSVDSTFYFYKQQLNRDVRIQELDLLPEEAKHVATALGTVVLPQNRNYLYHHYNDNCSTRPRDVIDNAIGGQLKEATKGPARMSLREHTVRYSRVNPPMSLVLDYLQNDELDRPITQQQEAYLPDELERQVQALQVKRADGTVKPLVRRQWNWYESKREKPPETAPNWIPWLLLVSLAFVGVLFLLSRSIAQRWARVSLGIMTTLFGLVFGFFGIFLFLIGLFTDHTVAHRNENLFLVNPLTFVLFPLGAQLIFNSKKVWPRLERITMILAGIAVLSVLVKVIPIFDQQNFNLIALFVPIHLGHWLLYRKLNANRVAMP